MSRSLDKDTIRALSSGSPSEAFESISRALTQSQGEEGEELLEIELLGTSHPLEPGTFLVQEENALGISKLGLVQAFFAARTLFRSGESGKVAALSADQLLAVTSVILLMDPEHLTAANARKGLIRSEGPASAFRRAELIRKDMFIINSLLTSRLHRHTKSPTLWNHRRWLIETAGLQGMQPDAVGDLKRIVMIAGERHPRNYYAWCHARWLTERIPGHKEEDALQALLSATMSWCFRHHTDVSGWSFLSYLLQRLQGKDRSSVLRETIRIASSLSWLNESTWVFLRTLVASGGLGEDEVSIFHDAVCSILSNQRGSPDRRFVEQAKSWLDTYQRQQR